MEFSAVEGKTRLMGVMRASGEHSPVRTIEKIRPTCNLKYVISAKLALLPVSALLRRQTTAAVFPFTDARKPPMHDSPRYVQAAAFEQLGCLRSIRAEIAGKENDRRKIKDMSQSQETFYGA